MRTFTPSDLCFYQFFNGTALAAERDVYAPIFIGTTFSRKSLDSGLDLFGPGVYAAIGVLIRNQTIFRIWVSRLRLWQAFVNLWQMLRCAVIVLKQLLRGT